MKLTQCARLFLGFTILASAYCYADEDDKIEVPEFIPASAAHANWIFSGVVTNENEENYGYFFQMQRDDEKFHAIAALFDAQSKRIILLDEGYAAIDNPTAYNWQVGRAFLRFNTINNSWIFGLKTKDKKGFNFKVDMLNQTESKPVTQDLRPGVELIVSQTSHLNGHVQIGEDAKEQFVTAKNAWFRQVWLSENQEKTHPFSGVLCRFNDGSGFYSVNIREADALRGAVTGSCDSQGMSTVISQFINVDETKDGAWHIRIASPKHHLVLSDVTKQNSVVAGFVTEGDKTGFCMLSKDVFGDHKTPEPVIKAIV